MYLNTHAHTHTHTHTPHTHTHTHTPQVMVYYVLHLLRLYHFCYPLLLPALLSLLIAAAYRLVLLVLALLHTQPKLAAKTA